MVLKSFDFGNEAADDASADELFSYFVEQESFRSFLSPKKRLLVATARRGVGKSALLRWVAHRLEEDATGDIIISIRGSDLVRERFGLTNTLRLPNDYIHDWMVRICSLINRYIAKEIGFAMSDDAITLVETAEIEGYKNRNIVGCLVDRLQTLLEKGRTTTKIKSANEIELLKRVAAGRDRRVWIILDDLDATFQNTPEEKQNLGTFFSACRYLARDVTGLNFRVAIRTDVWPFIRRDDEASGKLDQYREELAWREAEFLKLISFRIRSGLIQDCGFSDIEIPVTTTAQMSLVDELFTHEMKWGDKMVKTYKLLYTLSYERPRWAIQLCKLAQKAAVRSNRPKIIREDIDEVWGAYGAKRIDDVVAEHKHQCPEIEEILTAFRGSERLLTRDVLLRWIKNHISMHMDTTIDGKRVRDQISIARFLYRIGFLVARSDNADETYEHYRFDQMPDFLSVRTNDDFGVKWEIHPCYREALDIQKLNKSHKGEFNRLRR
jgi:hypothetical protein